jgi:hypothetical protein
VYLNLTVYLNWQTQGRRTLRVCMWVVVRLSRVTFTEDVLVWVSSYCFYYRVSSDLLKIIVCLSFFLVTCFGIIFEKFSHSNMPWRHRRSRGTALPSRKLGARWGWVVNATPRPFTQEQLYPLHKGLDGPRGRSGRVWRGENLLHRGGQNYPACSESL